MEDIFKRDVCCLIPIYQKDLGNVTKIITKDGNTQIDKRTVKTVLNKLCQYHTIHMGACREKYGKIINQRQCIPILIHKGLIMIPLKMRKPICGKDGAYGYVNFYDIKEVRREKGYTGIELVNGVQIQCLHGIKTVENYMGKAKIIAYSAGGRRDELAGLLREVVEIMRDVLKK